MSAAMINLEKYAQVISSEMMAALKEAAQMRGVSLDAEIALRLLVNMSESDVTRANKLYDGIIRRNFTADEAVAECKRKREAMLYLYELEKLRLFLQFERSLPRNIRETFTLINVKEATKQIKAELVREDKENQRNL